MNLLPITSLDDPRVAHYRNLKDRELAAEGGRFIAEGEHVTRRLLASTFPVDSLLLANRRVEEIAPLVPAHTPIFTASDEILASIIGFKFHSGILSCGLRKPTPSLDSLFPSPAARHDQAATLVICPEIINADNLGSLIRISAAFGAQAMLLGERSCDPFWRRSIRVSMGTTFSLPILHSTDLQRDLLALKQRWGVQLVATVLDESAEPLESARRPPPPNRLGLMLGSESQGLHRRWLALADQRVTIPMQMGTDSLNVAVAAGIFLYHFTRAAQNAPND